MLLINKSHPLFIKNLIIFFTICLLGDFVIGGLLKHYYFSAINGRTYQTTYSMDSTKQEILILGSSRAAHHYIPKIITENTRMTCYNTGRDGSYLLFNYAIFKTTIKRYNPRIIILDVNTWELPYLQTSYDCLSTLLPYYEQNQEIQEIVNLKNPYEWIKMKSSIYPFNSTILEIIKGNITTNNTKDTLFGYIPLYGNINYNPNDKIQSDVNNTIEKSKIDVNKVNALTSIIENCNKLNIKLLLIKSPTFQSIQPNYLDTFLTNLAVSKNIKYINFSNSTQFNGKEKLFKDDSHLNDDGAKFFTNQIVEELKKIEI